MTDFPCVGLLYLTFATKNWERDINRAMASLEHIEYPKDKVELICIESKSTGGRCKEWFEEKWMPKSGTTLPRITYIFNDERIGFDGNNNLGYEAAKKLGCEYVYLLNEDTDIELDFLVRAMERIQQDPKIAYVQSLLLLGEERNKVNTIGNAFHILGLGYSMGYNWTKEQAMKFFEKERIKNPDLSIAYASGAGVLGRMSLIDACGGLFDTGFFMYHEDTDASMRARLAGYKVVVEPSSIVYHYYEFAKSKWVYFYMDRNRYALIFSYYHFWTLILLFPLLVVLDLAMLAFSILRGWRKEKVKVYREWFTGAYWKWIHTRRALVKKIRVISDREFLKNAVADVVFQEAEIKNPVLDYIGNPLMRGYWWVVKRLI
jgi:GT2 family glycosyltransferase